MAHEVDQSRGRHHRVRVHGCGCGRRRCSLLCGLLPHAASRDPLAVARVRVAVVAQARAAAPGLARGGWGVAHVTVTLRWEEHSAPHYQETGGKLRPALRCAALRA